jgi:hypothetical protein
VEKEILLFAYFKGHGDGLHLASSVDGYTWDPLNNDDIVLGPAIGFERIMRDPCLHFGSDRIFRLVWTSGWNEHGIGYATSKDLVTWSQQEYLAVMAHEEKARNCWAPEIFYDEIKSEYILYWSSTIDGQFPETQPYGDDGYNHRIYYVTTRDFKNFSETKLLYNSGFNVIDANIVKDGDRYLLFMKDETLTPPKKHLRLAVGESPTSFGDAGDPITLNHYWAEGPAAIKVENSWIVYFDKYKINEIGAVRSTDLLHWEDISSQIKFPHGAQHGSVLRIPASLVQHLQPAMAHVFKT